SIVARSVCWRGGAVRGPSVRISSRSSSRATISLTLNIGSNAAARSTNDWTGVESRVLCGWHYARTRHRQRGNCPCDLTRDAKRFTTRCQDAHAATLPQQPIYKLGAGLDDVLAVVKG